MARHAPARADKTKGRPAGDVWHEACFAVWSEREGVPMRTAQMLLAQTSLYLVTAALLIRACLRANVHE